MASQVAQPHSFPPIADARARMLVLGSMPGVASLAAGQYYAHPRNAFWPIVGELFGARAQLPYDERRRRLRASGVAVWDVLRSCRRRGSLDAAIEPESETANDLPALLRSCPRIALIAFNGRKAESAFARHVIPLLDVAAHARLRLVRLPSTSPAHAGMRPEQKLTAWRRALRPNG